MTETKPPPPDAAPLCESAAAALARECATALDMILRASVTGIGSWHFAPEVLDALGARICRRNVNASSTERDQIVTLAPEAEARAALLARVAAAGDHGLLLCYRVLPGERTITPQEVALLGARVVVSGSGGVGHELDEVVTLAPELSPDSAALLRVLNGRKLDCGAFTIAAGCPLVQHGYMSSDFGLYEITPAGRARLEVL